MVLAREHRLRELQLRASIINLPGSERAAGLKVHSNKAFSKTLITFDKEGFKNYG
jgi:hypothetical protein